MRSSLAISALSLALVAPPSAATAQDATGPRSILTPDEIATLVAERAAERRGERSALEAFLDREEVRRVARDAGIEIADTRKAAATLDEDEIRRLAPLVRQAEAALVGGDTIVLSSTAIIIGLLILIIILVA